MPCQDICYVIKKDNSDQFKFIRIKTNNSFHKLKPKFPYLSELRHRHLFFMYLFHSYTDYWFNTLQVFVSPIRLACRIQEQPYTLSV